MTGTTGKAGPKGLGIDRTGITDHLALTFFLHLVAFSKHRVAPSLVTGSVPETEGVTHTGDPPCRYKIRPEDANQNLSSAYRIDPTRDTDQKSCLATVVTL